MLHLKNTNKNKCGFNFQESQAEEITTSTDDVCSGKEGGPDVACSINKASDSTPKPMYTTWDTLRTDGDSTPETTQSFQNLLGTDDKPVDLSNKKESDSSSEASVNQGILVYLSMKCQMCYARQK